MTEFRPDTCACIVFIDDKDGNNRRKMKLLQQCKSHNTVNDTMDYNKSSQFRTGTDKQITANKRTSVRDTKYQRR